MVKRKIIHIDMDAFFASVEQRDHPQYQGKPLIVGGRPDSRGVVAACSYEARTFGIHSAMPSSQAYRLCRQAIFVKPRFDAYVEASNLIREVFLSYTPDVEPLSLDEAYLDVSTCTQCQGSATLIAQEIKQTIFETTRLTASAGVSYNKFLAKIASDMDKPNGLFVIKPHEGPEFVLKLPIRKFHGIGSATEKKMNALGIYTGQDLRKWPLDDLQKHFGKSARYFFQIARGIDDRAVTNHRERKSIGAETTFSSDIDNPDELIQQLQRLGKEVAQTLQKRFLTAQTMTIKVKYANFEQITRSYSPGTLIESNRDLQKWLPHLLQKTEAGKRPVRLLGVSISGLESARETRRPQQLNLF